MLVDHSFNGLHVHGDDGSVMRAVRAEITLTGSGRIVPGQEVEPPILYRVISNVQKRPS